jgi:uncharacterized membrane protein
MVENRFRPWILVITVLAMLVTLWLVYRESQTAGHCPPYPLLGIPACYMVLGFFCFVLAAQFVKDATTGKLVFYSGALAGILTAVWFSSNQVLGSAQCPRELGIPLCYLALLTFTGLIVLRKTGER